MPPSSMDDLFAFLTQLMTEHASLFQAMGVHMYRGFAVILIVWFGVKTALASPGGGPDCHARRCRNPGRACASPRLRSGPSGTNPGTRHRAAPAPRARRRHVDLGPPLGIRWLRCLRP